MKNNFTNLKITGGELRGREILTPLEKSTHPMGSRERLALMNMLGPDLKDATLLDLFAGTGAIGIEALSRGAKHVIFVEKNPKVAKILRANLVKLGLNERAEVIEKSADQLDFLKSFDFVVADPPYTQIEQFSPDFFEKIGQLAESRFVLSHPAGFDPESINLNLKSTKTFASAKLSTFTK